MPRYRRLYPAAQRLFSLPPRHVSYSQFNYPLSSINAIGSTNFSTSQTSRSTNFDTLDVAQRLEAQGFTPEQSKAVMQLLKDVIDESIMGLTRTMVTREEQDKVSHIQPQISSARVNMVGCISTKSRLRTLEK